VNATDDKSRRRRRREEDEDEAGRTGHSDTWAVSHRINATSPTNRDLVSLMEGPAPWLPEGLEGDEDDGVDGLAPPAEPAGRPTDIQMRRHMRQVLTHALEEGEDRPPPGVPDPGAAQRRHRGRRPRGPG